MKAISILQPWATLIVIGAKKIETRSWATKYRGDILIHASAKRPTRAMREFFSQDPAFSKYIPDIDSLPYGCILGSTQIINVRRTEDIFPPNDQGGVFTKASANFLLASIGAQPEEKDFGDYTPGRYGWVLSSSIVKFDVPVPAKGQLGLWEYPEAMFSIYPELKG